MSGIDWNAEYNNRARVPEHPEIMAGWTRDASAYRREVDGRARIGLRYGPRERMTLDLFPTAAPGPAPVALFVHGGYWQSLDGSMFSHMARGPNLRGVTVGVVTYDLCPHVSLGELTEEIRVAAEALAAATGAEHVTVYGHSAGGHLTAMLLATDWAARGAPRRLVGAGLAVSGLFDLSPLLKTSVNDKVGLDGTTALAMSPVLHPAPAGTRLVAAVGGAESSEYHRQTRIITETWGAAGVETLARVEPGANHFTVVGPFADPGSRLTGDLVALATGAPLASA